MAWRETRGAWRHFSYFFICIAVGVGAVVAVSLFAAHVDRAISREARGLLGGDMEIRSSRALSTEGRRVLEDVGRRGIVISHASELVAMAAREDRSSSTAKASGQLTQIIELKAVEPAYPLYGTLRLEPHEPLTGLLYPGVGMCAQPCHGAVAQEALFLRLGLQLGDKIKIGQAVFILAGMVRTEPDRSANAFSLGPRVIVSQEGLRAADLVKPGSRVRERYLLKTPPAIPLDPLRSELRGRLVSEKVHISGYRDAQPQLKQFLDQLSRYLGLIGLTALFIGGMGVAMSIHAFLREKLKTIAILKSVGAESSTIIGMYVVQSLALGAIGSLTGMAAGVLIQRVLPPLLTDVFATEILQQLGMSADLSVVSIGPLIKGAMLGLLATLLFTMWPLLAIREIRPGSIFRREVGVTDGYADTTPLSWRTRWGLNDAPKVITMVALLTGLAGLSMWQAGNWKVGGLFFGGLGAGVSVLLVAATSAVGWLRRLPRPGALTLRYAFGNVIRPGSQSIGIMIAIGVSVTIIVTVSLVERALLRQVGETRPVDAPTFFFIDIQPDQREHFAALIRDQTGGRLPELTPLVRSRLHAVDGRIVKIEDDHEPEERRDEDKEERRKQWYLSREYVLTYMDELPKGNEIVHGRWWTSDRSPTTPTVSVEEEAAKALGVTIGSTLEFDIQGTTVAAQVSSVRKVDWGNFSTNFYMIFSPGLLEGAPHTYVGTIHVPSSQELPIQQAVVAAFPNVSAIHVGDVLENFGRVLDRLALAIRAVALFCLIAGGAVMASALAATRYQRLYESVILKSLGATRAMIARTFALEYMMIGMMGGAMAVGLASALSWLVLTYLFELSWSFHPAVLLSGLGLTILVTLLIGSISTYRILGQRPLAILRHE